MPFIEKDMRLRKELSKGEKIQQVRYLRWPIRKSTALDSEVMHTQNLLG